MITTINEFKSSINENNKRQVGVTIIDMHNDIEPTVHNFFFDTVEELDKNIDDFITGELQLRRVTVIINDFNEILTDEETDKLDELDYDFE